LIKRQGANGVPAPIWET